VNSSDYPSPVKQIIFGKVFSELGIRVFLENGAGSFETFLILQISDKPETLKRFQKQL
jgi:hypothetical protein